MEGEVRRAAGLLLTQSLHVTQVQRLMAGARFAQRLRRLGVWPNPRSSGAEAWCRARPLDVDPGGLHPLRSDGSAFPPLHILLDQIEANERRQVLQAFPVIPEHDAPAYSGVNCSAAELMQ